MANVNMGAEVDSGIGEAETRSLDVDRFARELRFILIDKAEGDDINMRIINAKGLNGIQLYGEVYKWFTETSGLEHVEQA